MTDGSEKHWWHTLPGILSAIAALIAAVSGLLVAWRQFALTPKDDNPPELPQLTETRGDDCKPPFVWRLAVPSDHVCVSEESRMLVELENQRAAERRDPSGGDYGADFLRFRICLA